jgi:hypothetical protein
MTRFEKSWNIFTGKCLARKQSEPIGSEPVGRREEDETECSETSAYKIQTPGNYPEESIQHSEHGESLKSRIR